MTEDRRSNRNRRCALKSLKRKDTVGVLLLGDEEVGKSSLIKRWINKEDEEPFTSTYNPTVEDYYTKPYRDANRQVTVGIVDIAGSGQFPAMEDLYISKADSIILVYEIGNEKSIKSIERYFRNAEKITADKTVVYTVVGTKLDKYDDVGYYDTEDIGKEYFSSLKYPPVQLLTSAKKNTNIKETFEHAIGSVVKQLFPDVSRLRALSHYRDLDVDNNNKKTNCCTIL